jgi:hypothetical protein
MPLVSIGHRNTPDWKGAVAMVRPFKLTPAEVDQFWVDGVRVRR